MKRPPPNIILGVLRPWLNSSSNAAVFLTVITTFAVTIFTAAVITLAAPGARASEPDRSVPDMTGRKPAHRVISLSPAITEMIYALGLEKNLVGVSAFSDYPKEASKKSSVGPYTKPNMEKILALHPDLVIVPAEGPQDVKRRLDQIHAPYQVVFMNGIDDIGLTAVRIGAWMGNAETGQKFKKDWNEKISHVFTDKFPTHVHVFIEVQGSPLIASGQATFLDEIVRRCGGDNVTQQIGYPRISKESLLTKKIDLVFLVELFHDESERKAAIKVWTQLPTMKDTMVLAVDPDITARPGPRLVGGIKIVCDAIAQRAQAWERDEPAH